MNKKTAAYVGTHMAAIVVAVATAVMAVGPTQLENFASRDPIKITVTGAALVVAIAAAIGAGNSGKLFEQPKP